MQENYENAIPSWAQLAAHLRDLASWSHVEQQRARQLLDGAQQACEGALKAQTIARQVAAHSRALRAHRSGYGSPEQPGPRTQQPRPPPVDQGLGAGAPTLLALGGTLAVKSRIGTRK